MEVFGPVFFKDFRCLGCECKDNCCRMGWDIEIDCDTYNYYMSADSSICSHIARRNGEYYIKQENGQCPFLNEKGLCSLLLEYGQEHISQICDQHPRFYQWFGGYNPYKGKECDIYTYKITNYKDHEDKGDVVCNLMICDNKLIGGDVCSTQLDGFMQGLKNKDK